MNAPRVHDLVRIDAQLAARWSAAPWVAPSLTRAPWVVVRRLRAASGIPVGVRGPHRGQRFAAWIGADDVRELLAPAQLVERIERPGRLALAARAVDTAARAAGVVWGPVGAYGFELASGERVTHPASDLDIAIDGSPAHAQLALFARWCSEIERGTGVRIDCDVLVADDAGIALSELLSGASFILAKTPTGPRLIAAP